jgi:DNA repair protein RadC
MTFTEMFTLTGIRNKEIKEKIEKFFLTPEKFLWNYEDMEELLTENQIRKVNILRSIKHKDIYDTLKDSASTKSLKFTQDVVLSAVEKYPKIMYQNTEMLIFILVNIKNEIVKTFKLESSAHDHCSVDIPNISRKLIINEEVRGFFTIHNHPSGECNPSNEDVSVFAKLKNVGDLLKVQNMDNIVIGQKKNDCVKIYSSYADQIVEVQL